MPSYCRRAFGVAEAFGNGTQRFIHLVCSAKFSCDVWLQHDHICTLGILCGMLSPNALTEVIPCANGVLGFRLFLSSRFFNSFSVRRASGVVRL